MSQVNLLDLAAAAVAASVAASQPIIAYSTTSSAAADDDTAADNNNTKDQNARLKLDGSVVTDADYAAQGSIIRALRKVEGDFIIVGEESPEEMAKAHGTLEQQGDDDATVSTVYQLARVELWNRFHNLEGCPLAQQGGEPPPSYSEVLPSMMAPQEKELPLVDACRVRVFVDPLDGTQSYANGDYDAVTTLIAIILDNTPTFGVICKPFGYKGHKSLLHTTCVVFYGGDLIEGVHVAGVPEPCKVMEADTGGEAPRRRAVISSSRSEGIVRDFCNHLASRDIVHPDLLQVSGAGEKSLRLIVGTQNETLWFFPKAGTSRWDVAASDALLRALGGKLTNKYGDELDYLKSREESENTEGIIASNNAQVHAECLRLFKEWDEADD